MAKEKFRPWLHRDKKDYARTRRPEPCRTTPVSHFRNQRISKHYVVDCEVPFPKTNILAIHLLETVLHFAMNTGTLVIQHFNDSGCVGQWFRLSFWSRLSRIGVYLH